MTATCRPRSYCLGAYPWLSWPIPWCPFNVRRVLPATNTLGLRYFGCTDCSFGRCWRFAESMGLPPLVVEVNCLSYLSPTRPRHLRYRGRAHQPPTAERRCRTALRHLSVPSAPLVHPAADALPSIFRAHELAVKEKVGPLPGRDPAARGE